MPVVQVSSNTVTLLSAVQMTAAWHALNGTGMFLCLWWFVCVCVSNWGCTLGAKGKHYCASFCSTCCSVAAQAKETDRGEDVLYCGHGRYESCGAAFHSPLLMLLAHTSNKCACWCIPDNKAFLTLSKLSITSYWTFDYFVYSLSCTSFHRHQDNVCKSRELGKAERGMPFIWRVRHLSIRKTDKEHIYVSMWGCVGECLVALVLLVTFLSCISRKTWGLKESFLRGSSKRGKTLCRDR